MKHSVPQNSPVVIYVNDPLQHISTRPRAGDTGHLSEQLFRPQGVDPHQAHLAWPELWAGYLKAAFAGAQMIERIALTFQVSDRCVRKWLSGKGGCNGRHVRVAMDRDRDLALQYLFAAE